MRSLLISGTTETMRLVSDAISVIMMLAFGLIAYNLQEMAVEHYLKAGPLPRPSMAVLLAIFETPEIIYPWHNFIVAWVLFIVAAGAGWMMLLGIRNTWIIAIRRISNLA